MNDDFINLPENKPDEPKPKSEENQFQPKVFGADGAQINHPKKRGKFHWLKYEHKDLSKKQWTLLISGLIVLIMAGSVSAYYLYKHFSKTPPLVLDRTKKVVKPKTLPSPLTGVQVKPELATKTITGVMIENSPDARPQAALIDAGVVYEAIAEGGITRFLALFQESSPNYIGPVRSARPYFLDFVMPFNASLAHVGGSPDALSAIRSNHIRDLDQFANAGSYWRISTRYAPHNMYTSIAKLNALENSKGFKYTKITSFPRKRKEAPAKAPSAKKIDFSISSYFYNVHYDYNAKTNSYARSEGGATHKDDKSKKQISPKVVIALVMTYGIASDGHHSTYGTKGSGVMFVFQDGGVTQGTWSKASSKSQIAFKDAQGKPIALNAGQTWITLLGSRGDIKYKP